MIIPPLYKYLGIGFLLFGLIAGAYYKGYAHEHEKLVVYQTQVSQAALDQARTTKLKDEENAQTTDAVANYYDDQLTALTQRLQYLKDHPSSLPKAPNSAKSPDAATSEPSRTCQDTEFYGNALEDALKVEAWQKWANEQHLQIGD